jgi:hypothetical protein
MGASKKGPFDIPGTLAAELVAAPNAHLLCNSSVVRPWANAIDITRRPRGMWIIDFGNSMDHDQAAAFEAPFEYARRVALPKREGRRDSGAPESTCETRSLL